MQIQQANQSINTVEYTDNLGAEIEYPLELNQDISLGNFHSSSQNTDMEYKALNLEFENSGLNWVLYHFEVNKGIKFTSEIGFNSIWFLLINISLSSINSEKYIMCIFSLDWDFNKKKIKQSILTKIKRNIENLEPFIFSDKDNFFLNQHHQKN